MKNEHEFRVHPRGRHSGSFPYVSKPGVVGHYSKHPCLSRHSFEMTISPDDSNKRFIQKKKMGTKCDLNEYFDSFQFFESQVEERYVPTSVQWLMSSESRSLLTENGWSFDIFCNRGFLNRTGALPYDRFNDREIVVAFCGGVWFILEYETEKKRQERESRTTEQLKMTYYGYNYERVMVDDPPPVNNGEQYIVMYRMNLEKHRILHAAEMDCFDLQDGHPVELKTNFVLSGRRRDSFFRGKMLQTFLMCFVANVPEIIVGFRDENGILTGSKSYETMHVHRMAKDVLGLSCWDPALCFRFIDNFLTDMKSVCTEEFPNCVYVYTWQPGDDAMKMTKESPPSERHMAKLDGLVPGLSRQQSQ